MGYKKGLFGILGISLSLIMLCNSTSVAAKTTTKAMVLDNTYYGRAQAIISASSGSASTMFTNSVISTSVSGDYRYNKANGSKGVISKSADGRASSTITFSHANAYSLVSTHYASCNTDSSSKQISIVY